MTDATSLPDRSSSAPRRRALTTAPGGQPWSRAAVVLTASLLLGGLTSFAQGFLPDAAAPCTNSASGWTLLTALLVVWAAGDPRARTRHAALLGVASFVLLVLGYTVAADLRGLHYDPTLFGVVGVTLVGEAFHYEIGKSVVSGARAFSVFVEVLNLLARRKRTAQPAVP